MDKLDQELKDKIEQLSQRDGVKATYLFAESVRKFLGDARSIAALDLVKKYHAGHAITIKELMASASSASSASALAFSSSSSCASAAATDAASDAASATADPAYYAADAAASAAAARRADSSITIESQIAIVDKLSEEEVCKLQDDVEAVFKITGTTESATIFGMQAVMTEQDKHVGLTVQSNLDNKITNLYFSDTGDNKLSNDVVKRIAVILCKLKGLGEGEQLSFLDGGIKVIDELQKNGDK